MKLSRLILPCCALISVSIMPLTHNSFSLTAAAGSSRCVACHTDLKKLIYQADVKKVTAATD